MNRHPAREDRRGGHRNNYDGNSRGGHRRFDNDRNRGPAPHTRPYVQAQPRRVADVSVLGEERVEFGPERACVMQVCASTNAQETTHQLRLLVEHKGAIKDRVIIRPHNVPEFMECLGRLTTFMQEAIAAA